MAVITKVTYIGNNSTMVYAIPFDYLSRSHVIVTLDDAETEYTWITTHVISFPLPPATGVKILIQRLTPQDEPWIVWRDGSVMVADELNAQTLQALYVLQENMFRLTELEGQYEKILQSVKGQEDLLNFATYSPIPFGGIYVDDEGVLCITVYGHPSENTIRINDDGELVITDLLPDYLGDIDDE